MSTLGELLLSSFPRKDNSDVPCERFLQGAFIEGERAGKNIVSCLKGKGCPHPGKAFHNKNKMIPEWYKLARTQV